MTERVEIVEVAPRDGLQAEPQPISTAAKIRLVDLLSKVGFARIEVASFVNPARVPQMSDGAAVMAGITRRKGTAYTALTPNLRGFEGAHSAKADEIAIFASASEGFSKANLGCTIDESFDRFAPMAEAATVPIRGYVSCVTDCPYDGPTPPQSVAKVAARLAALGCHEISLGDTIGAGTPESVDRMLAAVLGELPSTKLAGHFHDTKGRALDNIDVALERGLRIFDASAGGLGGCPFAPGAKGNVATEAVAARLTTLGFETGLDLAALDTAAAYAITLRSRA